MTTGKKVKTARAPIAKGLRFEVLKRDSFKCQYCGATAPEVVLHIDHIEALANGGANDITNLITACEGCNNGKSDKPLSENAAVQKSRAQLDELQARREQLEMMMEWREGLRQLQDDHVLKLCAYWDWYIKGWKVSDGGKVKLAKLAKQYTVDEICAAMDEAARIYLKHDDKGEVIAETVNVAFNKIGGVCRVTRIATKEPDIKDLFYIRGILRKRIPGYFKEHKAMEILKDARTWGISTDELKEIAVRVNNWTGFCNAVGDAIADAADECRKQEGSAS